MDDPKRREVKKDDETCRWKQYGEGKGTPTAMDVLHSCKNIEGCCKDGRVEEKCTLGYSKHSTCRMW